MPWRSHARSKPKTPKRQRIPKRDLLPRPEPDPSPPTAGPDIEALIERDGPACHYCRRELVRYAGRREGVPYMTRDHIVPRSAGGPDELWNYVLACPPCNRDKGARPPTCECRTCTIPRTLLLPVPSRVPRRSRT